MRIVFDIVHPAHLIFFKNSIAVLRKSGHQVRVLTRKRGDLLGFVERELGGDYRNIGFHRSSVIGKIFGLGSRVSRIVMEYLRDPFDVICGHGSLDAAVAGWICGRRSVIFYDTYEYRSLFELCRLFSRKFVVPEILEVSGRGVVTYRGYKELAHLQNLTPSPDVLSKYGVESRNFVLIRHIAHISLDCRAKHEDVLAQIVAFLAKRKMKIVASIENDADPVPGLREHATVIERPSSEMHSLMCYAACVISSGGTVAREAAVLGVPAVYIGTLDMRVQKQLIQDDLLQWPQGSKENPVEVVERLLNKETDVQRPAERFGWENITDVIVRNLTDSPEGIIVGDRSR